MNIVRQAYEKVYTAVTGKNRLATGPSEFTWTDWKRALLATKDAMAAKRISILAAGIAYFATFAFFPLVAASVAIAGLRLSPEQLASIVASIEGLLPPDIVTIVTVQLEAAIANQASSLIVAIVGIAIALFSISGAVTNLMSASNAIYERTETRNFIRLRLTSLLLVVVGGVAGASVIGLLLLNEPLLSALGIPAYALLSISVLRWLVIAVIVAVVLAVFYRYGPDRDTPKWQWVSWGSVIAAGAWLLVTAIFFIYARYFADFGESYSMFAGIIVLMTWFNFTGLFILLGAEVNFRLESQTLRKTTKR